MNTQDDDKSLARWLEGQADLAELNRYSAKVLARVSLAIQKPGHDNALAGDLDYEQAALEEKLGYSAQPFADAVTSLVAESVRTKDASKLKDQLQQAAKDFLASRPSAN